MLNFFQKILKRRNDDGASAVEYGLLVAAIAAVIVVLVFTLGTTIKGAFQTTCDAVASGGVAGSASCTPN